MISQEPSRPKKHDGKDRTGFHESRAKLTAELADHIESETRVFEEVRVLALLALAHLTSPPTADPAGARRCVATQHQDHQDQPHESGVMSLC